jgi:SpoIIAA-like
VSMFLSTTVESELLRVVTTGTFSSQAARKNFLEILDAVAQHQSEKVLFDGRKIMGEPDMMNRFYYGEFVAEALRKFRMSHNDPQFAYVLEPPVLHPLRVGETVAVNRGMNVKVFDNIADALRWLGVETASR